MRERKSSATSDILKRMLTDVWHAILHNCADIEFLLLAQGCGYENFEGMCCMNLSNHSE